MPRKNDVSVRCGEREVNPQPDFRGKSLIRSCARALALGSLGLGALVHGTLGVAQDYQTRFAGFAVYGTDEIDAAALQDEFAADVDAVMQSAPIFDEARVEPFMRKLHDSIAGRGDWALLDLGMGGSFDAGVMIVVVTIEVVEAADVARRMPFRDPPTGQYEDPDGVLAAWQAYMDIFFDMFESGEIRKYSDRDCPVLHCFSSFEAPALAPYLDVFDAAAREHEELLYEIAGNDADAQHRRHALATLAHTNDAARLLPALARAIYDSSGEVRNDAMRIMVFMARDDADRDYPVADLIRAMDFPGSAERNKAVSVLEQLVAVPRHAAIIRSEGLPNVLKLLRTPGDLQHAPAYAILKALSGRDFAPRDYAAWDAWVEQSR